MPTFALFPGARPGSTIGKGDVAMSAFLLSRSSQMRRYEPAPLAFQASLPALVTGTVMRGDEPTSTLRVVRGTSYRAFAGGSRTVLYTIAPTLAMNAYASASYASQVIATTTRGPDGV